MPGCVVLMLTWLHPVRTADCWRQQIQRRYFHHIRWMVSDLQYVHRVQHVQRAQACASP